MQGGHPFSLDACNLELQLFIFVHIVVLGWANFRQEFIVSFMFFVVFVNICILHSIEVMIESSSVRLSANYPGGSVSSTTLYYYCYLRAMEYIALFYTDNSFLIVQTCE